MRVTMKHSGRDYKPRRRDSTGIEILRWIGALPAALLASWLLRGAGPFLFSLGGMLDLRGPPYPTFLFPLLFLLPSGAAFTFVGASLAPRM